MAVVIKKYGNRRLYDGEASRYVTLGEIATKIRKGVEVRVVDAKTGADLTQPTLAQVILEDRNAGQLLPIPLLHQLIRMGDDALADFLGRYVTRALELYLQARQGMGAVSAFNPFASAFAPADAFGTFLGSEGPTARKAPSAPSVSEEVEALRREVDALKKTVRKRRK
jgi:polyhydroxyalkanoate synthesis repressor PhaR